MIDTPHQSTGPHNIGMVSDFETAPNRDETTGDWRTSRSRVADPLTERELDILAMISQGLSNKSIARALEISPETVKSHVKHIFFKLAVGTRTEAVFRALAPAGGLPRSATPSLTASRQRQKAAYKSSATSG